MRHQLIFISALAALTFASCVKQETKETVFQSEFKYTLEQNDSCNLEIIYSLAYYETFAGGDELRDKLNGTIVELCFDESQAGKTVREAFDDYCKYAAEEYQKDAGELYQDIANNLEEDEEFLWSICRWSENVSSEFRGRVENLQTYCVFTYNYLGGAHGMHYESLYLLDLKSGERVREEELFKEGYAEPVAALIREYAEKKYSSEEEEDFTYDLFTIEGLVPNGCCGVSEEGITWNYQPYEIASYAAGVISVTVPWEALQELLAQEYASR
jgi:hypothetical protein